MGTKKRRKGEKEGREKRRKITIFFRFLIGEELWLRMVIQSIWREESRKYMKERLNQN